MRLARMIFGLALLALVFTGAPAGDEVTLEGSFVWTRDDGDRTGDLKAVFTPDGDDEWSVAFHFVWEDEPHIYLGTAKGSLAGGAIEGTAEGDNEDHKPRFRFSGTIEDGTFNATHGYVDDEGSLKPSGTMTLRRPSSECPDDATRPARARLVPV